MIEYVGVAQNACSKQVGYALRKEIGSEFWSIPNSHKENHFFRTDTRWFLSGRSALECLIGQIQQTQELRTVAMPAWCCDSMVKPFVDAGVEVRFYPVYVQNGRFIQDYSRVEGCDGLFMMDYFGYSGYSFFPDFEGIRIRDMTHSVFSGAYDDAQYFFGSLRKWAGFRSGGFGWGFEPDQLPVNELYLKFRQEAMEQKAAYISGKSDSKAYLAVFGEAEEMLDQCGPAQAQGDDVRQAETMDISGMKQRRRENASILLEAFADLAIFPELGENDCPLFVPILVPNGERDALRRHLIEQEIYCPVHWPLSVYHDPDPLSGEIYQRELSLVCDQRYTGEDMNHLIQAVNSFWKD